MVILACMVCFWDLETMATIGRNKAVADIGKVRMHGWIAWVIWLVVHLRSILGIRNKIFVLLNWIWNYITYDYSLRLIIYACKAKVIKDRELYEAEAHWGDNHPQNIRQPTLDQPQ